MARVAALIGDLLFGSRVQAALAAAGDDVVLVGDEAAATAAVAGADVLVVDLTVDEPDGIAVVERLLAAGGLDGVRTLGVFAHVRPDVRERALAAGFDLVVPRSRMARDGAALVVGLLARSAE